MERNTDEATHNGYVIADVKRKEKYVITGSCGDYRFYAIAYDPEHSAHYNDDSNISVLVIRHTGKGDDLPLPSLVAKYMLRWIIKPQEEDKNVCDAILAFLKQLPPESSD